MRQQGNFAGILTVTAFLLVTTVSVSFAQSSPPFEVSNPRNQKLPLEEASKIYFTACEHVARAIRPENPPKLRPKFRLVLGTPDNETVRNGAVAEVHLKAWSPASFAEAVVIMAAREVLNTQEVTSIAHDTLMSAQASVSANDLKHGR